MLESQQERSFSVNSYHRELIKKDTELGSMWPWRLIWKALAPAKRACFGWLFVYDACLSVVTGEFEALNFVADAIYVNTLVNLLIIFFCTVITPGRFGPYHGNFRSLLGCWKSISVAGKFQKNIWLTVTIPYAQHGHTGFRGTGKSFCGKKEQLKQ